MIAEKLLIYCWKLCCSLCETFLFQWLICAFSLVSDTTMSKMLVQQESKATADIIWSNCIFRLASEPADPHWDGGCGRRIDVSPQAICDHLPPRPRLWVSPAAGLWRRRSAARDNDHQRGATSFNHSVSQSISLRVLLSHVLCSICSLRWTSQFLSCLIPSRWPHITAPKWIHAAGYCRTWTALDEVDRHFKARRAN